MLDLQLTLWSFHDAFHLRRDYPWLLAVNHWGSSNRYHFPRSRAKYDYRFHGVNYRNGNFFSIRLLMLFSKTSCRNTDNCRIIYTPVDGYCNIYTFTKSISMDLLRHMNNSAPEIIFFYIHTERRTISLKYSTEGVGHWEHTLD